MGGRPLAWCLALCLLFGACRAAGCGDVLVTSAADADALANCTEVQSLVLAPGEPLAFSHLSLIRGNLAIRSNSSASVHVEFPVLSSVGGRLSLIIGDGNLSTILPALQYLGDGVVIQGTSTCTGTASLALSSNSPALLITGPLDVSLISAACTLSELSISNLAGLGAPDAAPSLSVVSSGHVGSVVLQGILSGVELFGAVALDVLHRVDSLAIGPISQISDGLSVSVGPGASLGAAQIFGLNNLVLPSLSLTSVSSAPSSITLSNISALDEPPALSYPANMTVSINTMALPSDSLRVEACRNAGLLSTRTATCTCWAAMSNCSLMWPTHGLYPVPIAYKGPVLSRSILAANFSMLLYSALTAHGIAPADLFSISPESSNIIMIETRSAASATAVRAALPSLVLVFNASQYTFTLAGGEGSTAPGSVNAGAIAGVIVALLGLGLLVAMVLTKRARQSVPLDVESKLDKDLVLPDSLTLSIQYAIMQNDMVLLAGLLHGPVDLEVWDDDFNDDGALPPATVSSPPGSVELSSVCSPQSQISTDPMLAEYDFSEAESALPASPGSPLVLPKRAMGLPRCPPLVWAVTMRSAPAIRLLLEFGMDPNATNERRQTALHLACLGMPVPAVVDALLLGGADVNALDCEQSTPLMYACRIGSLEITRLLLAARADPGRCDARGMTALMHACAQNCPEIVRLLSASEAVLGARDCTGWTALHWAVAVRSGDSAILLVQHPIVCSQLSSSPPGQDSPLHISARSGDINMSTLLLSCLSLSRAQYLLGLLSAQGVTAEQAAMHAGHVECASALAMTSAALEGHFRAQVLPAPSLLTNQHSPASASATSDSEEDHAPSRKRAYDEDAELAHARKVAYMRDHRRETKHAAQELEAKVSSLEADNARLAAELAGARDQALRLRTLLSQQT
eukprot:m.230081 g.230081  ORF g.230081 m.230081 type:complete len:917 (-) comp12007_c0_seq1:212-2962(-)